MCVRYRYDAKRQKRIKTVELVVEEKDYFPNNVPAPGAQVLLNIDYREIQLRTQVKAAGGTWDPAEKAWKMTWGKVQEIGLEDRIRKEPQ